MENEDFVKNLGLVLKNFPGFSENFTHIIIQCPSCETNRDRNKHGHFYINKLKPGSPWDCKKCSVNGRVLTVDVLRKIGVDDLELISFANENNKVQHTHIVNLDERNKRLDYKVETRLNKSDKIKLKYLSDRLHHEFTEKEVLTYKIITNFSKFIEKNGIDVNKFDARQNSLIPILDAHYIGFLSYFGNIINFRCITEESKFPRYHNFILDTSIKRSYMFVPALSIDPLTDNPKINVAEGAIDIISIHLNNEVFDTNNAIYVSTNSVGAFRRAIKNALSITGYYGAEVNVYLDNEDGVTKMNQFDFSKIISTLRGFGKDFTINAIVNLASKDFGDKNKRVEIGRMNLTNQLK